jgi:homoserine dehydrogenase
MVQPLNLAIAGLGTVGTGLLDLIAERGETIAQRTGRRIEVVAVSARTATSPEGATMFPATAGSMIPLLSPQTLTSRCSLS